MNDKKIADSVEIKWVKKTRECTRV
jgi:hypothetical protein